MRKLFTIIGLISCLSLYSQNFMFMELKGGYSDHGMVIGAGIMHNIDRWFPSLEYKEYNTTFHYNRELDLSLGYEMFNGGTRLIPSSGIAYRWNTGEIQWVNSLQVTYDVSGFVNLFVEYQQMDYQNIMVGMRVQFRPSKIKYKRFF